MGEFSTSSVGEARLTIREHGAYMTHNGHWRIDTNDFCLSANFSNAVGEFTDVAPAAVTEARRRYPELCRLEDKIWEDSQPTGLNGFLGRGIEAREQSLIVYRNTKDGRLLYDRRYVPVLDPKTGKYSRIPMPRIIPVPRGYTLFIVEHTHPFTWGFGTLPDRTMRGPSPADFVMARNNPQAFHVLQAKPPKGKPREFLYFGPRK